MESNIFIVPRPISHKKQVFVCLTYFGSCKQVYYYIERLIMREIFIFNQIVKHITRPLNLRREIYLNIQSVILWRYLSYEQILSKNTLKLQGQETNKRNLFHSYEGALSWEFCVRCVVFLFFDINELIRDSTFQQLQPSMMSNMFNLFLANPNCLICHHRMSTLNLPKCFIEIKVVDARR